MSSLHIHTPFESRAAGSFASRWRDLGQLRSFCHQYLLGFPFHLGLYSVAADLLFLRSTPHGAIPGREVAGSQGQCFQQPRCLGLTPNTPRPPEGAASGAQAVRLRARLPGRAHLVRVNGTQLSGGAAGMGAGLAERW